MTLSLPLPFRLILWLLWDKLSLVLTVKTLVDYLRLISDFVILSCEGKGIVSLLKRISKQSLEHFLGTSEVWSPTTMSDIMRHKVRVDCLTKLMKVESCIILYLGSSAGVRGRGQPAAEAGPHWQGVCQLPEVGGCQSFGSSVGVFRVSPGDCLAAILSPSIWWS